MGDLLFYLLKSGCYLIIFYLLFKLLMSGTTFFRFNRVTILAGIIGCMFLPLIEFTTQEETFLTVPLQTIQGIFVEQADGIFWDTMFWVRPQVDETGNMQAINWCPIALGYVYLAGGLFVLCRILLSFYRMFQLIRNGKRRSYGKYKLIVVSEPISSFCWGKYIVVSVSDYSQQSTDGILLHETMHLRYRHTLDLLCMQCLLILYWFNPAIWLLKRELQEVHEFEADNGVLNTGIDATRYQLLLVKKAVGTRLYSMANGFNHSKLKKRITMMLKERTNRWARLKLLFVVPVMGGALYAFAQPEVKEDLGLNTVREVLQSKTREDQDIFKFVDDEMEAYYNRSPKNAELKYKIRERQTHIVKVDANGQLTLNNKTIAKEDLKEVLKKTMVEHKRLAKEKYNSAEDQVGGGLFSPDTPKEQVKDLLSVMRDAFVEIRADIAQTSGNNSKEYLDKEFPILIGYGDISIKDRKKNPYNNSTTMKITGIHLKLLSAAGKVEKEITNFTLAELERDLKDFCTLQGDKKNEITVSMKVDKGCEMGIVTDVKTVLRNNYLLKLNYQ